MTLDERKAERRLYSARAEIAYRKWREWQKTKNTSKRQFWHDRWVDYARRTKALDALISKATANVTHVSPVAPRFISEFEGGQSGDGRFHPYWDSAGSVWTQGYGHTENVHRGDRSWSRAEALSNLQRDLDRKYGPFVVAAAKRYGIKFNQRQFDALVSLVYNVGPGLLERGHSVGDALARHDLHAAGKAILLYDFAGGQRLAGLTRRRQFESHLFLS